MANPNNKLSNRLHMVIGCGRLGSGVATMLSSSGISVVLIDKTKDAFNKLSPSYTGYTIEADACDMHALENAGIKEAGVVLVSTGYDNVNIMVSQIAKVIYEVPKVITRLNNVNKEAVLKDTGISVIYPVKLEIEAFREIFEISSEG